MTKLMLKKNRRLYLRAETVADLMTPNPISLQETATLKEAEAFLIDRGFSAAPVVDDAGRPVGVVSQTDIVIHDRESPKRLRPVPQYYAEADLQTLSGELLPDGFQVENVDPTLVGDIMTPVVLFVSPDETACQVVSKMLGLNVHRLFVLDEGILVGVISAFDILRRLDLEPNG